jgi:hypothetical protein
MRPLEWSAGPRAGLANADFHSTVAGNYPVSLAQSPVPRQVSDANAVALNTSYINGTITVNPFPSLKISQAGQNIRLSWPLWATNFALQMAQDPFPQVAWTNVSGTIGISNAEHVIMLPINDGMKFYRLSSP